MRDSAVDLVKAACLMVVVGLHVLMGGITVGEDGPTISNALAGNYAFAWSTWAVQIMPLFFLLGGFASITQWRRMREAGSTAGDYIRQRVNRLARPAVLPIAIVGTIIAILYATGVSPEVLGMLGLMIRQPLWFLAVYIGCSALIPVFTRLHEKAPRLTIFGLLIAALVIDTISVTFRLEAVSYLNFFFVWLFIQQLGFWWADGFFARIPRWVLLACSVAGYGVLAVLTLFVGYSIDMYVNLNPPTTCIVVLSVAQVFLIAFLKPWITSFADLPRMRRVANAINGNSMTIYLWHVPVAVVVGLVMVFSGFGAPEPLSLDWWQGRPIFLLLVGLAMFPVVALVRNLETSRLTPSAVPMPTPLAALKAALAMAGVVMILLIGFTPLWNWAVSLVLLIIAVLIGPPRLRLQQSSIA